MPLASNYGGLLQNFALQTVLKKKGFQSITLRFPTMYQNLNWIESHLLYINLLLRYFLKKIYTKEVNRPLSPASWKNNISNFERFIVKNINVTEYINNITVDICVQFGIDLLIVGSDQIWRPNVPRVLERYFCSFARGSKIKRISYGASLAIDKWTFNERETREIHELLGLFHDISVREIQGVELLRQNVNITAKWVLDPTMLLQKKDYLDLISSVEHNKDNFIFAYILDQQTEKKRFINDLSKKMELKVFYLDDKATDPHSSIEKWLSYFRDAEFIVTDSFHGTVFSIIFEKQFVCFENKHRGNSRIDSLKIITGLSDRFMHPYDVCPNNIIDYSDVSTKINEIRKTSMAYLINNMKIL